MIVLPSQWLLEKNVLINAYLYGYFDLKKIERA